MTVDSVKASVTIEDIIKALRRLPDEYLPEVLQYIEFVEYKTELNEEDIVEDEDLWQAVEVNQAYKEQQPDEPLERYTSGEDFLKAVVDL